MMARLMMGQKLFYLFRIHSPEAPAVGKFRHYELSIKASVLLMQLHKWAAFLNHTQ